MARGPDRRARRVEIPLTVHEPSGCQLCGRERAHQHSRAEWATLTVLAPRTHEREPPSPRGT